VRYPWVNAALLVLLFFQLVTGFFGLVSGAENLKWILWLHGIGGYAIVVILLWKTRIIIDTLDRVRRATLSRSGFLILAAVLLVILATGLAWIFGGRIVLFGLSLMTIHALAALVLMALLFWHTLARQYILRVPASHDRRAFLRTAATLMAGALTWWLADPIHAVFRLPGSLRRFTGSYEVGSRIGDFPTVIWLSDSVQPIEPSQWRLVVGGEVERQLTLSQRDILSAANDSVFETIDCTGGWYSTQEWRGVRLAWLLDLARVKSSARSVTIESVSGYARRFAISEARGLLVATHVAGEPLNHEHGAPARLVAPGHRGFEWVKWVVKIQLDELSELIQSPLPLH
jgi:DMSO/TMAO reductase YedYZ molybdopterin-dependent catalytic subunit